jgi:hypothetical protein
VTHTGHEGVALVSGGKVDPNTPVSITLGLADWIILGAAITKAIPMIPVQEDVEALRVIANTIGDRVNLEFVGIEVTAEAIAAMDPLVVAHVRETLHRG